MITIETICRALESDWRISDHHRLEQHLYSWGCTQSKLEGMELLLIQSDLANYKALEDDLNLLWYVAQDRRYGLEKAA